MTMSKEHKDKVAIGVKKPTKKVLGRLGGADLNPKPTGKFVSKSRFGKVRNAGHKANFTSQAVPLMPERTPAQKRQSSGRVGKVTQFKRIAG
ncbi:MAG: hypothetical protein L0312_04110, partial [Acidobacteria bacterium]|nr:hypothetical protein [Acidobacteriota bacterium]